MQPPLEDCLDIDDALDEEFARYEHLPPSHGHGFRIAPGRDLTELYLITDIPGAAAFTVRVTTPDGTGVDADLAAAGEWITPYQQLAEHETAWSLYWEDALQLDFAIERPGDTPLEFSLGLGFGL